MEEDLSQYAYLEAKHAVLMDFDQYNSIMPKRYYFILIHDNYNYKNNVQILRGYIDALKYIKENYGIDFSERCK